MAFAVWVCGEEVVSARPVLWGFSVVFVSRD